MRFRLSVVLSDYRVGATKTAIRYKVTRQFVFLGSIGITMMISVPSPIRIQCVQTDNGSEFTHRLRSEKKTLFEEALRANGIDHHPIRPAMPRHNGKVERSHREDQKRLYDKTTFYPPAGCRYTVKEIPEEIKQSTDASSWLFVSQ